MKIIGWIAIAFFNCFVAVAQEDSLTQVVYDTLIIHQPPVIINRKVLSLPDKVKPVRQLYTGLSIGINYFTSIYYTCKECGRYNSYAKTVDSSQRETPGINVNAYVYRNLGRKLFYELRLGYSLYTERFKAAGMSATNYYHQLGFSASLLYPLHNSEKSKLFLGLGASVHYLLSSSGKTVTIRQQQTVSDMNEFRTFNNLLGGVQVSAHWLRQVKGNWYFLLHPEVAFEITSFTSYHEYYLQNRFLYAINLGLVKKI